MQQFVCVLASVYAWCATNRQLLSLCATASASPPPPPLPPRQLFLVRYGKGGVMSHFEQLQPNYFKRGKPLKVWEIEDHSELVCELVPNADIAAAEAPVTTGAGAGAGGGSVSAHLELAKQEQHRRKHSLQVTITAPEIVVATVLSASPQSPGAEQLKREQRVQVDLSTKVGGLLPHLVKTYHLPVEAGAGSGGGGGGGSKSGGGT